MVLIVRKNILMDNYPIKSIIQLESIDNGNISEAKLIRTTDKRYILRKMRNAEQACMEYEISEKLMSKNISPQIIATKQFESYIRYKGNLYNLQSYIPNENKKSQDINYFKLGETVSLFHQEVKGIRNLNGQVDRFSLDKMLAKLSNDELYKNLTYNREVFKL